jgi:hypothetical protein
MIRVLTYIAISLAFSSLTVSAEQLERKTLLDFDSGSNKDFTGWVYSSDITGYNNEGWRLDSTLELGSGTTYFWGAGPRSFDKGDYGKNNTAIIDRTKRAPSDDGSGGSFKVYETDASLDTTDNRSTWWTWYDGRPLSERGITTSNTNRMSFYLFLDGVAENGSGGGENSVSTNFHIGTYLCWDGAGTAYGVGDGCPYEGVGNQHYYHYLALNSNAWIHVLLDQHPTHRRGLNGNSSVPNNPSFDTDGKNYFEHLNQMYMEIRYDQPQKTAYWLDELEYYFEDEPENEDSITSLWVGYWGNEDYFEIGFQDTSFTTYNGNSASTFEIRWSDAPITNANYDQAERVLPLFYSGVRYSGDDYLIRRANSYRKEAWTRFELPNSNSLSKVYFAVKDVSIAGDHAGTAYPWNRVDGHNAPSNFVKTIDLVLHDKPKPPINLEVTN